MRASLALFVAGVTMALLEGCASHRRAGLHLDPVALYDAALEEHGGIAPVPAAPRAAEVDRPVLMLPFGDRTLAPHGSYLDETSASNVAEIYVVPDLVEHLRDFTVDALRAGGAQVFVVADRASARGTDAMVGTPLARLEVTIDAFEIHRWDRGSDEDALGGSRRIDVVRVTYRYRWRGQGIRTASHRLLIRTESDALAVVARYIAREVADHAGSSRENPS